MTQAELLALLPDVKAQLGFEDEVGFQAYLETTQEEELRDLALGVEKMFGVHQDVFLDALRIHLILQAKPWAKEQDIRKE